MFRTFVVVAVTVLVAPPVVHGADWRYAVEYRPGYSSNIARTADNEIEDYTNTLVVELGYQERSSVLEASVAAAVEYLSYRSDVFADETRSALNADLRWALLRDRIFWVVEDLLTVEPVLYRQAWTPGNIQQTNVLSTGPSLSYRLEGANRVTADLRFINSYAEITKEYRSNRWYLAASLIQQRSVLTDLSANLTLTSTDFALEYANDYRQADLYMAWDRRRGSSGFRLELGGYAINFDEGKDRYTPHLRFAWNRVISSASRMRMILSHGFSDAAQSALGRESATPPGSRRFATSSNTISSQVYESSELDLLHRIQWARSNLETGLNYQKQVYMNSPDMDQSLLNVSIVWNRGFGGSISTELGLFFARTEYDTDGRGDDTVTPFFGVHLQRSSRIYYSFRVEREVRDSSVDSADYDDLMVFAALGYRL